MNRLLILFLLLLMLSSAVCGESFTKKITPSEKWALRASLAQKRLKKTTNKEKSLKEKYLCMLEKAYACHERSKKDKKIFKETDKTESYSIIIDMDEHDLNAEELLVIEYQYDKSTNELICAKLRQLPSEWIFMATGSNQIFLYDKFGNSFRFNLKNPFISYVAMASK